MTNIEALVALVGRDNVLSGRDTDGYVRDWRGRYEGSALAVVRPGSTAELAACVAWARATGTPMVPQGGNTGMCGGAVPDESGRQLVVSLTRMNRIRSVDLLDNTLTAEAGCVLQAIQEKAGALDRHFPLSLGSEGSCQIGGNISTNAGGTEVLRYGPMRDLVLGLEVVLPNGEVLDGLRRLRKNNAGYDTKHLFIGAEGTLGFVTAAVLKLFPRAKASVHALCGMATLDAAVALFGEMNRACGHRLGAFEAISDQQIALVHAHTPLRLPLAERHPWYVLITVDDPDPEAPLMPLLERALGRALEAGQVDDVVIAQSEAQAKALWHIRHSVADSNRAAGMVLSHDTCVPTSRTADFIREVDRVLAGRPDHAFPVYVGHLGDGNIHVAVIFPREHYTRDAFEALASGVNDLIYDISVALGGSIIAEHGVGRSLQAKLPRYVSPVQLDLMRALKRTLDPMNLMNPGKVLSAA